MNANSTLLIRAVCESNTNMRNLALVLSFANSRVAGYARCFFDLIHRAIGKDKDDWLERVIVEKKWVESRSAG